MTHTYNITGMTCGGCVAKAKNELLKLGDITAAEVQLSAPQATISMQKHIPVTILQDALSKAGNYTIQEAEGGSNHMQVSDQGNDSTTWFTTYKPLLIIGAFITGVTLLIETTRGAFVWQEWMPNF